MKVLIDLTQLRKEGKITQAEFDKFSQLSSQATASLGFNIFIGLGITAVVCGTIALVPTPFTAILLGLLMCILGLGLLKYSAKWTLLGRICIPIGALLLAGGILWLYEGIPSAWLSVTALLLIGAIIAEQSLLMVLAILALSATIGAQSGYYHASYWVGIDQPTLTIIIFSLIAFFAYWISEKLEAAYERLAIIASRTCVFLVNFGFWIGSLWGDRLPRDTIIPDWAFALVWAFCLLAAGIWAIKMDKRWLLNVTAVFAGIHFYTQWFERLGASPLTLLIAGIVAIVFALFLKKLNGLFKK